MTWDRSLDLNLDHFINYLTITATIKTAQQGLTLQSHEGTNMGNDLHFPDVIWCVICLNAWLPAFGQGVCHHKLPNGSGQCDRDRKGAHAKLDTFFTSPKRLANLLLSQANNVWLTSWRSFLKMDPKASLVCGRPQSLALNCPAFPTSTSYQSGGGGRQGRGTGCSVAIVPEPLHVACERVTLG